MRCSQSGTASLKVGKKNTTLNNQQPPNLYIYHVLVKASPTLGSNRLQRRFHYESKICNFRYL